MNDDFYKRNGKQYERVTDILKTIHDPGLENLRRVKGFYEVDQLFKTASERGKAFHSAMAIVANGKFEGMIYDTFAENHPDIYPDILNAKKWLDDNVEKIIFSEKTFYDDKNLFAGTPDLLVRLKGDKVNTLIDYKTGSKILPIYRLQLAAYTHLIEKDKKTKVGKRIILQVRDGKIKEHKIKSSKELDINLFFYVLYLKKNLF